MDDIDFSKYYTREQLDGLAARELGAEEQRQVLERWERLFADIEACLTEDPASPAAQRLVDRWDALIAEFTQNDPGLERSLDKLYSDPNNLAKATEAMPRLPGACAYIQRARAARRDAP